MMSPEERVLANAARDRALARMTPEERVVARGVWDRLYSSLKARRLLGLGDECDQVRLVMLQRLLAGDTPEQAAAAAEAKAVALAAG